MVAQMSKKKTLVPHFGNRALTPIQAIRAHCIDCSGNSSSEADRCHLTNCNLHFYRMGINPNRHGIGGRPTHQNSKSTIDVKETSNEDV